MDQFGCFKASSTWTSFICSLVHPRNGPPDAVRRIFSILFPCSPFKHWKIALCSLSTGRRRTFFSFASGMMRCPPSPASPCLPVQYPFRLRWPPSSGGYRSCRPPLSRRSHRPPVTAISKSPSMPETIFVSVSATRTASSFAFSSSQTPQIFGENSRIWLSSASILLPAAIRQLQYRRSHGLHPRSGFRSIP